METIIRVIKKAYTKAEITASASGGVPPAIPPRQKAMKTVHHMSARVPGSSGSSSTSDSDGTGVPMQPKGLRTKRKSSKSNRGSKGVTATTAPSRQPANPVAPAYRQQPLPSAPPMTAYQSNTNNLNAVLNQFAPPISSQPMVYKPRNIARGPRWACPLDGHAGHDLQNCLEFWEAKSCKERRDKMMGSACFCCLGKDQGCARGACEIMEMSQET